MCGVGYNTKHKGHWDCCCIFSFVVSFLGFWCECDARDLNWWPLLLILFIIFFVCFFWSSYKLKINNYLYLMTVKIYLFNRQTW